MPTQCTPILCKVLFQFQHAGKFVSTAVERNKIKIIDCKIMAVCFQLVSYGNVAHF